LVIACVPSLAGAHQEQVPVILFKKKQATVRHGSLPVLDAVAERIKAHPEAGNIRIEGHTCGEGNGTFSAALSQRRAETVRAYLVGRGVDPTRLEIVGYADDRPMIDPRNIKRRWQNRRVEFRSLR
jgi:outer membrane protein OmpA-like peptidoglycan-associated protein